MLVFSAWVKNICGTHRTCCDPACKPGSSLHPLRPAAAPRTIPALLSSELCALRPQAKPHHPKADPQNQLILTQLIFPSQHPSGCRVKHAAAHTHLHALFAGRLHCCSHGSLKEIHTPFFWGTLLVSHPNRCSRRVLQLIQQPAAWPP